jgi:lipoate---protein ligase
MQIIYSTSNSPSFNLAAEEFLFSERQDDLLFLYVNNPSVIIGSNQAIRNEVDMEFCIRHNIQVVRRMSGGGAVYHDEGNLNYCFISNKMTNKPVLSSDFILPIIEVLSALGIPVNIGKRKDVWLTDESKISGTASHIGKIRELHHGTLLYDANLDALENALRSKTVDATIKAIPSVRSTVKNLRTWFEEQGQFTLSATDFFELLAQKLVVYFQQERYSALTNIETEKISELAKKKYMSEEWTYKK